MKRRGVKRSNRKDSGKMEATLAEQVQTQLRQISLHSLLHHQPSSAASSSLFQNLPDSQAPNASTSAPLDFDADPADERDFILSQDLFCTPDYITPDNQNSLSSFDCNKENIPCPKSPEKLNTVKRKRIHPDGISRNALSPTLSSNQQIVELAKDSIEMNEANIEKTTATGAQKSKGYVSQSAVALRCRVMPPPCIKNPYLKDASKTEIDPFGNQRSKCTGFFRSSIGGDGLSRYHTDFHEIELIGIGNFSQVFKVLKRIDGCMYAVKHSTRQLHQDTERMKALMEVQALGALGSHENIVAYYSSWFENEQLYIQMELCDYSLSRNKASQLFTEGKLLKVLFQIAKALQYIHERGIAHLDIKPENIYVKNGVYKLGDFGCATLLNKSLGIEEGDARYMPQEILNENYDRLDKVDVFSLGAAIYELIRQSPFSESGAQFLRDGKLPLLPGHSLQFQNLLKVMVDRDPARRPSAKEIVENPIFNKIQ
ncbi:hypothetical protein SLA2020_164730 [Shorea laevis]